MMPPFPPAFPLVSCLLALHLFGWGFNAAVAWVNRRRLFPVSFSVAIGSAVTLLAPMLFFLNYELAFWQSSLIYFLSFTASGIPMIFGNVQRQTNSHKARRLGNHAAKVRDDVVMDLDAAISKIVRKEAEVVEVVHMLHKVIGSLKSL